MTKDEAIKKLKALQDNVDAESAHVQADDLLCQLLVALGCGEVIAEWRKATKWYA